MFASKEDNNPGTQSTLIPILGKAKECKTSFLKKKKFVFPVLIDKGNLGSKLCQVSTQVVHKEETNRGILLVVYSQNH